MEKQKKRCRLTIVTIDGTEYTFEMATNNAYLAGDCYYVNLADATHYIFPVANIVYVKKEYKLQPIVDDDAITDYDI